MEQKSAARKTALRESESKVYSLIKIRLSVIGFIVNFIILGIFAFSPVSLRIVEHLEFYFINPYIQYFLFVIIFSVVISLAGLPIDYYGSFIIEHAFGLSNQTHAQWLAEQAKSAAVSLCIGIPVAFVFFYFLRITGTQWWIYFSAFVFVCAIVLAQLAPLIIFPLFYTFTPLEEGKVTEKIMLLMQQHNIRIKGIFSFNMSKDTKKANAGFAGMGRTKRIILSDTLLEKFTADETLIIFAHELGHYIKKHILKNIAVSGIVIFTSFYVCSTLYSWTIHRYGFLLPQDVAAIPILLFYLSAFSFIIMPLSNMLSRYFERQADRYAITVTRKPKAFISAMERLAKLNLSDKNPHPIVEFLFFSHPSLSKRIEAAKKFQTRKAASVKQP